MKLLIIGNGFDKWCGLKSSFNDFFSDINNIENKHFFLYKGNKTVTDVNDYYNDYHNTYLYITFIEKYILYMKNNGENLELHWSDLKD